VQNQVDLRKFKNFSKFKERFLSSFPENAFKEDQKNICWNYQGSRNNSGYGIIGWGDKDTYLSNRLSYIIFNGLIPYGKIVRHTCDNRLCVNPKHLILGTYYDNSIDSVKRNRQAHMILNEEAVKVIKWFLKYKPKRGLAAKLARLYNITPETIGAIKTRKSWSWVQIN
jgi:hypothetical protein